MAIKESELILNPDGSVYHLNLLPKDIADTIILVGDPGRVERVSKHFDSIELEKQKREFVTHTGFLNGKRLTVISTGIGTDNIDIVLNELDALANINLSTREIKPEKTVLNFIRFGTSGSVNPTIKAGNFVVSDNSVGFDGLMLFYKDFENFGSLQESFLSQFPYEKLKPLLYFVQGNASWIQKLSSIAKVGNTGSLSGFYGPQGRELRLKPLDPNFLTTLNDCGLDNFEMETSAIYAFAHLMGHKAASLNAIIANRTNGTFTENPKELVNDMIKKGLQIVTQ